MVSKTEREIESLKLRHEEYKIFLQISWGALMTFTISLLFASFTKQIKLDSLIAVLSGVITILSGIIITTIVFNPKFNNIRNKIKGVRK